MMDTVNRWSAMGRVLVPIVPGGKRPAVSGWANPAYKHDIQSIRAHVESGAGVGWVVPAGVVVLDVDPRNGGAAGLRALSAEYLRREGCRISQRHPVVKTGGGGVHIYGALPTPPVPGLTRWAPTVAAGVEVKRIGHQVLIPGSPHPSGTRYQYDHSATPDAVEIPHWPQWLADRCVAEARPTTREGTADGVRVPASPGAAAEWTDVEIRGWLSQLPACEYSTNDTWQPIMMAAHEATGGADYGLDALIDWSRGIPGYGNEEKDIQRWRSLTRADDREAVGGSAVTRATICAEVRRHTGVARPAMTVDDLAALDDALTLDDEGDPLGDADELRPTASGRSAVASVVAAVAARIATLDPTTATDAQLQAVLVALARCPLVAGERLLRDLSTRVGLPLPVLRRRAARAAAQARDEDAARELDDAAHQVSTAMIQAIGADSIVLDRAGVWWVYHKGAAHWTQYTDVLIGSMVYGYAEPWCRAHPEMVAGVAALCNQAHSLLSRRAARDVDLYGVDPQATTHVVALRNCALQVDSLTGVHTPVVASPGLYQSSCLKCDYDPAATCPTFDSALRDMFCGAGGVGGEDVIRHLWELIGYTIQPRKDLATWVMLTGTGSNGKSVVLDVLSALLGTRGAHRALTDFGDGRDSHALAELAGKYALIDDDLDTRAPLPDAFLKRISENKTITINPKYKDARSVENTAITWMGTNQLPRAVDASNGLYRRGHIIRFGRVFLPHEQDTHLKSTVIGTELSGVLNRALEGLRRLRARGTWDMPATMVDDMEMWRGCASPGVAWMRDALRESTSAAEILPLRDAWGHYRTWSMARGLGKPMTQSDFRRMLSAGGWQVARPDGYDVIVKAHLRPDTEASPAAMLGEVY